MMLYGEECELYRVTLAAQQISMSGHGARLSVVTVFLTSLLSLPDATTPAHHSKEQYIMLL